MVSSNSYRRIFLDLWVIDTGTASLLVLGTSEAQPTNETKKHMRTKSKKTQPSVQRTLSIVLILGSGILMASSLKSAQHWPWATADAMEMPIPVAHEAPAATWVIGDVFAGLGKGEYNVYDNAGNLKETIKTGLGLPTTGCSFNRTRDKLYTTYFSENQVIVFDNADPHDVLQTIATGSTKNESIVFDTAGNFYVGHADGDRQIEKYDSAGNLLATYSPTVGLRGTDWIDLAADERTIFYTSEDGIVRRFDVSTDTQLPDFASVGGILYALRILPPGDGSGGVLVAHSSDILRLDASGNVVQTYSVPGETGDWFALNLDPNGTSFWSGLLGGTNNFYRFNIATGAVEVGPISHFPNTVLAGLCVKGEITAVVSEGIVLAPPSSTDRVGQMQTVTATVQDDNGNPVTDRPVTFDILSGPNEDLMETINTDENGKAAFTHTSTEVGTDTIEACFTSSQSEEVCSTTVDVTWIAASTGLRNLSTRAHVMDGDRRTIGGFIITGDEPKEVLIRGIGPSLPASVPMKLSDPVLSLFDSSLPDPIATNNDWKSDQQTEIEDTGLAPQNDLEAGILATLAPGAYTAILEGNGGSTGIGLVEIYDITPDSNSMMANMSTRSQVETEDNVMIGGLIIDPAGDPIAAVIRAIGPSLDGVPGTLEDPTLDLHDANGVLIASNDNWQDDPEQSSIPTGLQPSDPRESALYRMLDPGAYTAIVRGATETSGIGLVEIYALSSPPTVEQ